MTDYLNRVVTLTVRKADGSKASYGKVRAIQTAEGLSIYRDGQHPNGDWFPEAGVTRVLWFPPVIEPAQAGPRKSRPVYEWTDSNGDVYKAGGCPTCGGMPRSIKLLTVDPAS